MSLARQRVLVTGAGGFIGSRATALLARLGVQVQALVRRTPRQLRPGIRYVRGDVTDAGSVARAATGCDLVFHCAWGGDALEEARRVNVTGTVNVLEAAARAGARRVVHLSTMAVHGDHLPAVLDEDAPIAPGTDAYGLSKAEGERAAFERGRTLGVEVVALRPTLVYGPASPYWLISYFERVKHEQVALIDGGSGLANLVHVDDVVDAMIAAADRSAGAGQAFLVSGPAPVTWATYLGAFAAMCGKPTPPSLPAWRARLEVQVLRVYGLLADRPRRIQGMDVRLMTQRSAVSIERIRRVLGWQPKISFDDGMRRCAAWLHAEGYLAVDGWDAGVTTRTVADA